MGNSCGCGCSSKSSKNTDNSADTTDRVGPAQSGEKIGMSEKDAEQMKKEAESYAKTVKK